MVYIKFRDLNKACPKKPFQLPHIDLKIDTTSGYETLSFMNAYSAKTKYWYILVTRKK